MKQRITPLLLTAALLCAIAAPCQAESSVWRVEKGGHRMYLGGTVHMLKPEEFPLPAEFATAYNDSQELVFEADIGTLSDPDTQAKLLQSALAQPGRQLKELLSESTYRQFAEAVTQRGLDIGVIGQFKAGMAMTSLQAVELMRLGYSPEGVDSYFYQKAGREQKPRRYLESLEGQFAYLNAMGEGQEELFVQQSLAELKEMAEQINHIIKAWRSGDSRALEQWAIGDMQRDYPKLYQSLLVSRNQQWMPKLEKMANSPQVEFVLVGVAHMVGKQGLLNMLQQRGYTVSVLRQDRKD